jgi:hypothetical protein
MNSFQICDLLRVYSTEFHASVAIQIIGILKLTCPKQNSWLFLENPASYSIFHFYTWNYHPITDTPHAVVILNLAFSLVPPPTHSVHEQVLLALSPTYYPCSFTVFHGHDYHLDLGTIISFLFCYSSITVAPMWSLPDFTLDLLESTPNIYLKCKPWFDHCMLCTCIKLSYSTYKYIQIFCVEKVNRIILQ